MAFAVDREFVSAPGTTAHPAWHTSDDGEASHIDKGSGGCCYIRPVSEPQGPTSGASRDSSLDGDTPPVAGAMPPPMPEGALSIELSGPSSESVPAPPNPDLSTPTDGRRPARWGRWLVVAVVGLGVLAAVRAGIGGVGTEDVPGVPGDEALELPSTIGSSDAPLAIDSPVQVVFPVYASQRESVWNVQISGIKDMTAEVAATNPLNDPPDDGMAFAGFDVEMTLVSADDAPREPGSRVDWEFMGGATGAVAANRGLDCGVVRGEFNPLEEVAVGDTLSGSVCIPLAIEDLDSAQTEIVLDLALGGQLVFAYGGVIAAPDVLVTPE